ncbi:MAG: DUF5668 domain-containing protein [Anaerolineae bacterium]
MSEEKVRVDETPAPGSVPAPQPSRPRRPYRGGGLAGALILITLGVIFLLDNLGMIEVSWLSLWRFWPVLLILIGLDLLLGRRSALGSILLAVLSVIIVVGVIFLAGTGMAPRGALSGETVTYDIEHELAPEVESLQVDITIGAASTNIYALSGSASRDYAVLGSITTNSAMELVNEYEVSGDRGTVRITQKGETGTVVVGDGRTGMVGMVDLGLTAEVPLDLVITAGAGEGTIDLSGLTLQSLEVTSGVGALTLILPGQGDYDVSLISGVGAVTIELPRSLEAQMHYEGASIVDGGRLERIEAGLWETDGYAAAANRAEISIQSGIGAITFKDR